MLDDHFKEGLWSVTSLEIEIGVKSELISSLLSSNCCGARHKCLFLKISYIHLEQNSSNFRHLEGLDFN